MPNTQHVLSVLASRLRRLASKESGDIRISPSSGSRSSWGMASLRLRVPYHFKTSCMMGFQRSDLSITTYSGHSPSSDNHDLSLSSHRR
jgi:hypothetical protein